MTRRTLISLGSINADFQVRLDEPPGSQETLLAHDFSRFAGGKAANVAYLGARFGHSSHLLGCIGDDGLADKTLAALVDAGADVDRVHTVSGQATGVSMIMVPPDGKKQIVLATNANDQWPEEAVRQAVDAIESAALPACLVLDYEVPAAVVRRAVDAARKRDIPVILDPSFPDRVEPELLSSFHALTPNPDEAGGLVGLEVESLQDAARAARQLRDEKGVEVVCIKLGDGGCVLAAPDTLVHVPADDVDVVDSTGAGDAFTGVFAIALLEGESPRTAAAWGVAAANHAVTGYGSQPAYPSREQLLQRAQGILQRIEALDA
ncbi:PfkB family carbohydrate kinase [Pseudomonas sp. Marseille-QA0892]